MKYEDYLAHFNPNHDPRNGQFTSTKYQTASGDLTKRGQRKLSRSFYKSYNRASANMSSHIQSANSRYSGKDLGWDGETYSSKAGQAYLRELDSKWRNTYMSELRQQYPKMIQNGERWMQYAPQMDMYSRMIRK